MSGCANAVSLLLPSSAGPSERYRPVRGLVPMSRKPTVSNQTCTISVRHGDTAEVQYGIATFGSRNMALGGTAILRAMERVLEKMK